MKKILVSTAVIFLTLTKIFAQSVGISDQSGQTINASAVLDVQSTTKGVLIPRMDSTTRKSISSPAEGLLVYDTNTKSFWFYGTKDDRTTASWREVLNGGISDRNKVTITDNGGILLSNAATIWNDLVVNPFSTYRGATDAIIGTILGSVKAVLFEAGATESVYFSVQMPHGWKEGSTIYPHLHWSPQATGTGTVNWGFEYSWGNYDANTPQTFPATTTLTTTATISTNSSDKHLITAFSSITDATKKISSILICRLYRVSNGGGADTFGGSVALLSFDFHYESDGFGSDQPFVK